MTKETKELLQAIIEDNKKYPPKVIRPKCNDCQNMNPRSATCNLYPNGIPIEILKNKETCEEFKQK